MKVIILMLGIMLSLNAASEQYSGWGTWKKSNQETGSYSDMVDIDLRGDLVVFVEKSLKFYEQFLGFAVRLERRNNYFFSALNDKGEKIGEGNCGSLEYGLSVCYLKATQDGFKFELDLRISPSNILRWGAMPAKRDQNITLEWHDRLYRAE